MAEYIVLVGDIAIAASCHGSSVDDANPVIYTVTFTDTLDGTETYMADIASETEQLDILTDWLRHDTNDAARERLAARGLNYFLS